MRNASGSKSRKKRKRKLSAICRYDSGEDVSGALASASKKERLSADTLEVPSESKSIARDDDWSNDDGDGGESSSKVNGVIQLMTGVHTGQTPLSADVKKKKRKKKKRVGESVQRD